MKLQSASATCGFGKCPYTSECKGSRETCKMKEVAMIIRAELAEIESVRAENIAMRDFMKVMMDYIKQLEAVNTRYYKLVRSFQDGYRPKEYKKKKHPRIGSARGRKKKDPVSMDGDERYAMPVEPKEPKPEVVIL